jgi:hypothetical protein
MPLQVFVDESGGKGHSPYFFMAGLLGHSDDWDQFCVEWRLCMSQTPAIRRFKMKDAAGCSGEFRSWRSADRDAKLRSLAQVINRHAKSVVYVGVDLDAHAKTWATTCAKPLNDPYFFPFHTAIAATCLDLWDHGWREAFEIIFDEQRIQGPRANNWYEVGRAITKIREPDAASILPSRPVFASDDVRLPLQAADLFAWCFRNATTEGGATPFEWVLEELRNVKLNQYSAFYDLNRMQSITKLSHSPATLDQAAQILRRKPTQ